MAATNASSARLPMARCCSTILDAYEQYAENSEDTIDAALHDFATLSAAQQALVPAFPSRMQSLRQGIAANSAIVSAILKAYNDAAPPRPATGKREYGCSEAEGCGCPQRRGRRVYYEHQQLIENLMMQLYREWGTDGACERSECFAPLVDGLSRALALAPAGERVARARVLVPGAGLCRLPWELARAGHDVEACECSHSMMLAAHYVLTGAAREQHELWPFVHVSANVPSSAAMSLRTCRVPDVQPSDHAVALTDTDFVSLCRQHRQGHYDALVTCFFIDTAFNILDYIEAARDAIKPGGFWVNHGPLHWVHGPRESIRLTMEEIETAMERMGFEFVERETKPLRHYCSPPGAYMPMVFDCRFWIARKRI
eukprot:m51a1_g3289 hypothetical protein (371) ;mRNA; r:273184-274503